MRNFTIQISRIAGQAKAEFAKAKANLNNFLAKYPKQYENITWPVVTICSGYDSQVISLMMSRFFNYCLELWSDNCPSVSVLHNYLFPNEKSVHHTDFTKIDWGKVKWALIAFLSTPCQDLSMANAKRKLFNGEKSSLLYSTIKLIETLRPPILIAENVFGEVLGKEARSGFLLWLKKQNALDYNVYYKRYNGTDSQNRPRIITVGIRKDLDSGFKFSGSVAKTIEPLDVLETEVDDSYYFSKGHFESFVNILKNGGKKMLKDAAESKVLNQEVSETIYKCFTCLTKSGAIHTLTASGARGSIASMAYGSYPYVSGVLEVGIRKGCTFKGKLPQVTSTSKKERIRQMLNLIEFVSQHPELCIRLRRLTERCCYRMMGVPDDLIDIMLNPEEFYSKEELKELKSVCGKEVKSVSSGQHTHAAGNSVIVDVYKSVLEDIERQVINPNINKLQKEMVEYNSRLQAA